MVSRTQLNSWKNLKYYDPVVVLRNVGEERSAPVFGSGAWDFEKKIQRDAKITLEVLDAAVVAFLLGKSLGFESAFSPFESGDHDCILRFDLISEISLNPLQLKEIVPTSINPRFTVDGLISSLSKYSEPNDLIVAIKVGRDLDEEIMNVNDLGFAGIYFYGHNQHDSKSLWIRGDCQKVPETNEYLWPEK